MKTNGRAGWESSRGDDWWWTTAPQRTGSLNPATSTFSIDEAPRESARLLWDVLVRTAEQFQGVKIACAYDGKVGSLLDQLQREGKVRWSDADNPHSRYARITFNCVYDPAVAHPPLRQLT